MLLFDFSNQFKKDLKLLKKRGKDLDKIFEIIIRLIWEEPLPERYREHNLHGNLEGYTECHVEVDWIVLYKKIAKQSFFHTPEHIQTIFSSFSV